MFSKKQMLLFSLLFQVFIYAEDAPSKNKLKGVFYFLEKNFSLDNRFLNQACINSHLLPLAESSVEAVFKFFPDDLTLNLEALRTLYVQGNHYLRHEKFALAESKLNLAKKWIESRCKEIIHLEPKDLCFELAKVDSKLPNYYAMILFHLGVIPIYYKEGHLTLTESEKYLTEALEIQEVLDESPYIFQKIPDNNKEIGDAVIFKRTLGYVYFEKKELDKAEKHFLDLLVINDAFHQLITHRMLMKIYQKKGQLAPFPFREEYYQKAEKNIQICLKLLHSHFTNYSRTSSTLKDIGNFYNDDLNPFKDLEKAKEILDLAKKLSHSLPLTEKDIRESLCHVLYKLFEKEQEDAFSAKLAYLEKECIDSLKLLKEVQIQSKSYEKLGDVYLEKGSFSLATAFYIAALKHRPEDAHEYQKIEKKITDVEKNFLEKHRKTTFLNSDQFWKKVEKRKQELRIIRNKTQELLKTKEKIEDIYLILGKDYKLLLNKVFEDILDILGKPPTDNFAIIYFGSIGRGLATPYSDLEFTILFNEDNEDNKYYFKLFSELLEIRIMAFGENPISFLNLKTFDWIQEVNEVVPRGLMLDPGEVVPHKISCLGTPSQVAYFIHPEHPSELAKKSVFLNYCHGFGKEYLTKAYQKELEKILQLTALRDTFAKNLFWKDQELYFNRCENWMRQSNYYSIKHDFFRPFTNMLDAWAIKKNLHTETPWQMVEKLYEMEEINTLQKENLQYLLDKVAELRLKTYLAHNEERHWLYIDEEEKNLLKPCVNQAELLKLMNAMSQLQKHLIQVFQMEYKTL